MIHIKQLVCPISEEKINEQVTRINALFGIVLLISGFVFNSAFFFVFPSCRKRRSFLQRISIKIF